jgi:hypothetical protein
MASSGMLNSAHGHACASTKTGVTTGKECKQNIHTKTYNEEMHSSGQVSVNEREKQDSTGLK